MIAPWQPFATASHSAAAATAVLPEPTSPCSSRPIGRSQARSARISARARLCAAVISNGSACEEGRQPLLVRGERYGRHALEPLASGQHAQLQHEEFVEAQPAVCGRQLVMVIREVNLADGPGQGHQAVLLAQRRGQEIGQLVAPFIQHQLDYARAATERSGLRSAGKPA